MTAVLLLARATARRHWRGLVVLTLLIGLAGAAVLASAAGARRTSTALRHAGTLATETDESDPRHLE